MGTVCAMAVRSEPLPGMVWIWLACREQRGTIRIRRAQRAAGASLPRLLVLRIWFVTQRGIGRVCFVRSPRFTLAHRRHLAAVSGPRSRMRTSCWAGQTVLAHTLAASWCPDRRLAGPGGTTVALTCKITGAGPGRCYVLDACLDSPVLRRERVSLSAGLRHRSDAYRT